MIVDGVVAGIAVLSAAVVTVLSEVAAVSVVFDPSPPHEDKRKTQAMPRVDKNFNCLTVEVLDG